MLRRRKEKEAKRRGDERKLRIQAGEGSRNDFLFSINIEDNKAAANDANDLLVDEYGHNNTLVHRWSCIWPLST